MAWQAYLTNALIAAALGAGTNELAIIAILRYILPRKKGEMARRIRDIVASELITPERMREKMDDPAVEQALERHTREIIAELLQRDLPAPIELLADHRREVDALAQRLRETIMRLYTSREQAPGCAEEAVKPFLRERWEQLRQRTPASFLTRPDEAAAFVRDWVAGLEHAQPLRRGIRQALDGWLNERMSGSGSLAGMLSPGLVAAAEELAAEQAHLIIQQLADVLRQPSIHDAIVDAVMQSIRGQLAGQGVLGNIKGAFVSIMKIERDIKGVCERLPDALYENLNQPGNRERFEELIKKAVRSGLEKEFDPVLHESSARGKLLDAVMDRVWSKRNFARLARGAEKLARAGLDQPMAESVDKLGLSASVTGALDETAIRIARMLSADATRTFLGEQIDEVFQLFLNRPIGKLGRLVSAETVDHIAAAVADEARLMLRSRLSGFADEAGVWDIIVESIESYDNQRLARLVQQLARSELRWVTVLGGVIGAVVGILQTFLHTLDIL